MGEFRCPRGYDPCKQIGCTCRRDELAGRIKAMTPERQQALVDSLIEFASGADEVKDMSDAEVHQALLDEGFTERDIRNMEKLTVAKVENCKLKLELESLRQELARKEGTISRYAESLLLAWGGVCPRDWAIDGDPQSMAEQIRREGDRLQTENNSLNAELARKEEALDRLTTILKSVPMLSRAWLDGEFEYNVYESLFDKWVAIARAALSQQADKEGE